MNLNQLQAAIMRGEFGLDPESVDVTGAVCMYQTTQFPGSTTKYHNYYVLMRVQDAFGACSHTADQLAIEAAAQCSGQTVAQLLLDNRLPVRIAAMDAYLGAMKPHRQNCTTVAEIAAGAPLQKAKERDAWIANTAKIVAGSQVALIGVVNPLVEAIVNRGGICLPCDLQMDTTQWGQIVEKDMNVVLDQADSVICTGMTLSNGSFDHIAERARERGIPLTVYAQTGSSIVAQYIGQGVTAVVAEPFPFTQFSGGPSELFVYE